MAMKLTLVSVWCNGVRVSKFVNVPDDMVESDGRTIIPESLFNPLQTNLLRRARFLRGCDPAKIRGVTYTPGG